MMEINWYTILVVSLLVVLPAIAARSIPLPAMVITSFMVILLPLRYGLQLWTLLTTGISFLLLIGITWFFARKKLFRKDPEVELKRWRIIARPFALLFVPIEIRLGHRFLLYLLGVLAIIFICTDLYRLFSMKQLSLFFKKDETRRFSSMTSFVVSIFIVFLLFPEEVAFLCLGFIIFGDMAAKLIGLGYGCTKIIHGRTLEGSLGFFTGCIYIGYIMYSVFDFPFGMLMIGAASATLAELFSFSMDDNFTVGILTGGCLMAMKYFGVIG